MLYNISMICFQINGIINVHIWEMKEFANFGQILAWIIYIAHGTRPKRQKFKL